MKKIDYTLLAIPKEGKVKLSGRAFQRLQEIVFASDHYRCRVCLGVKPLQMHHVIRKSKQRLDTESNCLSLCADCHELEQRHIITIEWDDQEKRTILVTGRDTCSSTRAKSTTAVR